MQRLATVSTTVALAAISTGPALAAPGTPGTMFPEQPGTHNQAACTAISSNSGALTAPRSETAFEITNGVLVDACLGGSKQWK